MDEFSPLKAFCDMHHDVLIDGSNTFGPAGVGRKCRAFLWSKTDIPVYRYAFKATDTRVGEAIILRAMSPKYVDLQKWPGEVDGYFLYVLV